jgi:hypothetical protein
MADTKISALPASTVPLAGTEVLPIVQSSTTKQVSVANLTAGRAISATQITLTTGNVIVASGQGIDFSATSHPAGMTSELLADYEEGTWTPILGGSATYNAQTGSYTKVGRLVYVRFNLNILAIGSGSTTLVSGLPFTPSATRMAGSMAYWAGLATNVLYLGTFVDSSGFNFISQIIPGADVTDGTAILGSGTVIHAAAVYFV